MTAFVLQGHICMWCEPFTDLHKSRMQVDVMRHYDGSHDPDGLLHLRGSTAAAVRQKHALQHLALVWSHTHILQTNREQRDTSHTERLHTHLLTTYCSCTEPRNQSWQPWWWWGTQRTPPASSDLKKTDQALALEPWHEPVRSFSRSFSADLPYLSKNRKTKVSMMVINTPAHRGILQKNINKMNELHFYTSSIKSNIQPLNHW